MRLRSRSNDAQASIWPRADPNRGVPQVVHSRTSVPLELKMNSISGVNMKKSFSKVISVSAALVLVGSLASCGGDNDTNRNRNTALDSTVCLDGSTGTLTADNNLKISSCATAVKYSIVAANGTDGAQENIVDGGISIPVVGRGPVTVKTFNAEGAVIATDVVKPNGSRGGIVYRIDTSGEKPVYYEAAPIGWSGTISDPRTGEAGIQGKIDAYNNASTPAADWYLGNEWEMRTILVDQNLSRAVGVNGGDGNTFYWTSKRNCSICALMIESPSIAQYGYTATFAYGGWTNNFIRPIRSFTAGTEAPVAVLPPETTTTTTVEETTTTQAPVPTTIAPEPEVQVVIDIINPNIETVEVPAAETTVSVTPALVEEWVSGGTTTEIETVEITFDGQNFTSIALDKNSDITIPATATEATLRVTTKSGEKVEINKILQRTGAAAVATSTTTSTIAPTPADDVVDVNEVSTTTESDSDSSSNTILVILGAIVVLIGAGSAVQIRRKKK